MAEAPRLTVIVPAFNEASRLAYCAARFATAVEEGTLGAGSTELIVVDDGSTDDTSELAEALFGPSFPFVRVLRLEDNAGKGAAIRHGTAAASAPVVLFIDVDMSVDPSQIPRLVEAVESADVAIGTRSVAGSVVESCSMHRKLMGRTFNLMVRRLTSVPFRDTQCGFKAFRTPVARLLFHLMSAERFAFDVEVLSLALRLQMDIAQVGIHWREMGESKVRPFLDPLLMTLDVLGVSTRRAWPDVPGLSVRSATGALPRSGAMLADDVAAALGPAMPILAPTENGVLVLLPLAGAAEIEDAMARLSGPPTALVVERRDVPFVQLDAFAPFRSTGWIDGSLVADSDGVVATVTSAPVNRWRSPASDPDARPESSLHV